MRCFLHHDKDSVGVCKSCGKGLCVECAVDLGKGLACRERCEADVRALIAASGKSFELAPRADGFRAGSAVMYLAIGGAFAWWGHDSSFGLIMWLGVCFVAFALYTLALEWFGRRRRRAS